jgi:hypothetical protein
VLCAFNGQQRRLLLPVAFRHSWSGWTQQLPDLGGTVNPRNLPRLTRLPIEMPLRRMTLVRQRNGKRFSKGDWSRIHAVLGFDLLSISFFYFIFQCAHPQNLNMLRVWAISGDAT